MDLNKFQTLCIPFSVMWCTQLGSLRRYRLFNTHYLYGNPLWGHQARRFVIGLLFSLGFPLVLIYLGGFILDLYEGVGVLMASVVYSMSLFGVTRVLHAFVFSDDLRAYFYNSDEYGEMCGSENFGDLKYNRFYYHFAPGLFFLLFFPGVVYVFGLWRN